MNHDCHYSGCLNRATHIVCCGGDPTTLEAVPICRPCLDTLEREVARSGVLHTMMFRHAPIGSADADALVRAIADPARFMEMVTA